MSYYINQAQGIRVSLGLHVRKKSCGSFIPYSNGTLYFILFISLSFLVFFTLNS